MIKTYLFLFGAIFCEVAGTMLLPVTQNFTKLTPTSILAVCYLTAFYLLTFVVNKLPIAIVYATWSGLGVFTIAILGYIFFKQNLSWQAVLGLFFIVLGVLNEIVWRTQSTDIWVNFKVFPTRFRRTWRNRLGSPRSACGTCGSSGATRCRPLSWAGLIKRLTISCRILGGLKSTISRSSLRASIFEKSRISFKIVRRDSAELLAVAVYSCCSGCLVGLSEFSL